MSSEELQRLDEQGMAAWDQHNPDDFVDLFAEDFTFSDVTRPEALRSKDEVRQYMESWFTAFPDMRILSINRVVGDDAVAGEVEFTGTNTGPLVVGGMEMPATGKSVTSTGAYFFSVRDGKIASFSARPDGAGLMEQLGLLPGA
ncbi:ester cyclase [Arthrobacter cavernae]|uniref:Ester cyclase n=1 Tax=Arthrobacter cavernae TaxID=2817681 RepID=A0A939HFL9_9MICC|nr:ester cyclase [Arthrobacter cavernae]MBO1268294.1 ester cyclase [Arthrobacter cavernae]